MEQLLGVDISNLNRFDPSLQTVEPRDQIWMTPGTAFWLVGTLLMERGMLRSIKARADLSAATFEAARGRGRQRPRNYHARVEPASRGGERRPVTTLFADVVGSTGLAETMDPEEWAELIGDATTTMGKVVDRYGGRVSQVLGDGILAFFGVPVAHEDDPQRAVRAGLDLIREMRTYATSPQQPEGSLQVRVGLNTGLAVTRDVSLGASSTDYTALGDAVNVAARLQAEAAPNTVLIGPTTYAFVSHSVNATPRGPLVLKGKANPIRAYEVTAWIGGQLRQSGVPGLRSPMVGRDVEFSRLSRALRAVRAGRGRVAVLRGEPGIGKSRLVTELRRHANDPPMQWLEAACVSYGQEVPYALTLGILRALLGFSDEGMAPAAIRDRLMTALGSAASDVGAHMAQLLSLDLEPWEHEEVIGLAPDALRAAYIEGIGVLLRSVIREPTVFVCEDVHWADEASVDLLAPLLRLVHELPVLVMLLARPDRDVPGWRLIGTARDEFGDALVELPLAGLPEDQSRTLVGNLLVIESLPSGTRDYILARSEGNPLFVEEVIRMLIDRGLIRRDGERWIATKEVADADIPDTIHGLLLARIDRLPPEIRRTLRAASVIGRQFPATVLADVVSGS
jgi:class 3 adenylate cyclase